MVSPPTLDATTCTTDSATRATIGKMPPIPTWRGDTALTPKTEPPRPTCLAQGLSNKEGYHRKKTVGACRSGERHTDRLDRAPQGNLDKSGLAERRFGYPHVDLASLWSPVAPKQLVKERERRERKEEIGRRGMREIAPRCPPRCG